MNRLRKKPERNYDATPEPVSDPTFDIRRGIITLVLVMTVIVLLSLICAFLR
ncbi:MAG: hypothetical protein M9947_05930 [Thermomicrobiales bacterium]|nr:hypothetical protein [Thermomicrobiales bacterium]